MKKVTLLILAFIMCFSFCSCVNYKEETPESTYAGTYVCDYISWVPLTPISQHYNYDEMKYAAPNTQKTIFLEKDGTGRVICQVIKGDVAGIVKVGAIYYEEINFKWHVEDGKIITTSQTRFLLNTETGANEIGEPMEVKTKTYIIDGENFYPEGYQNNYYRKQP